MDIRASAKVTALPTPVRGDAITAAQIGYIQRLIRETGTELQKVLDYFGISPKEALFVGDGDVDMQSARSAGVPFISYKSDLPAMARIQHHREIVSHVLTTVPQDGLSNKL